MMHELLYPGDLTDVEELAFQLSTTGLSLGASALQAKHFAHAVAMLSMTGDANATHPPLAFFVPGRIEVLGKHTDYAGGRSLVTAVERGISLVARPRNDSRITIIDAGSGETIRFPLQPELQLPTHAWAYYPMTVAHRIATNFPGACRGADMVFCSNLPSDSGLCSSCALMVGTFLVLAEANQLSARNDYWHNIGDSKIDLARYLGAIQHGRGFGTLAGTPKDPQGVFGGSEDTIAILCAEANHISQYAYCPVEFEKVLPIPPGYVFAVGVSGVPSQKDGDAGNKCRLAVEYASALIALWQRETGRDDPHLAAALNGFPDAAARWTAILKTADCGPFDRAALSARLEHFMLESGEIIPEAGNALAGGDLRTFGRLVDRSQQIAEQLLGTQTPETNFLVASARRHDAVAASAFGMGVGGSVWALVEIAHADAMLEAWANDYRAAFPHHAERAEFFITHAGPAAVRVC